MNYQSIIEVLLAGLLGGGLVAVILKYWERWRTKLPEQEAREADAKADKAEVEANTAMMTGMQVRIDKLYSRVSEFQEKLDSEIEKRRRFQEELTDEREKRKNLASALALEQAAREALNQSFQELKDAFNREQELRLQAEATVEKLRRDLEVKDAQISELEAKVARLKDKLERLEKRDTGELKDQKGE